MADQRKLDFDVSVSTRLPASVTDELDRWAERNYTDRSKTLRAFILTIFQEIKQKGALEQSLGDVLRRLRLEPV